MNNFGLYVIVTNPVLSYQKIAEICVQNEIKMLQIREKSKSDFELLQIAKEITEVTSGTVTNFIFNDRTDLAILSQADGLHLGQSDIPIEMARTMIHHNKKMLIGLSTHSLDQAKNALKLKPDYIGFGPIYKTPTKTIPDPVVGTENLETVLKLSDVPVVAIGGINKKNIEVVLDSGAKNLAMVRQLMETKDLNNEIKYFKSLIG